MTKSDRKSKKKLTKPKKKSSSISIKKKTRKTPLNGPVKYTEDQLQYDLGNYIKEKHPCAIVNGCLAGSCGRKLFSDMIRKHYRKGWPDLFIANPRGGHHGLFIELKSKSGKLREDQIIVLKELHEEGYKIAVINDYESGCDLIDCYFSMSNMKNTIVNHKTSLLKKKKCQTLDNFIIPRSNRQSCEMIIKID